MNPQNTIQARDGTQLDPSVVALAKSMGDVESGGKYDAQGKSGEYGKYQYTEPTWHEEAGKYLGNQDADIKDPTNQDKVVYYKILDKKNQGYTPEQIASEHNSGNKDAYLQNHRGVNSYGVEYDTPGYVNKVITNYNSYKNQYLANHQNQSQPSQTQQSQDTSGALFPASANDTGITAGFKALGNTPGSAINFGKGVLQGLNPINTANNIGQIGSGLNDLSSKEGAGNAFLDVVGGLPRAAYETLVPKGIRQVIGGDIGGAAQTLTNDPFGQTAPVVLGAQLGAQGLDALTGKLTPNASATANYIKGTGDTMNGVINDPDFVSPGFKGVDGKSVGFDRQLNGTVQKNIIDGLPGFLKGKNIPVDENVVSGISKLNPYEYGSVNDFTKAASDVVEKGNGYYSNIFGKAVEKGASPVTVPSSKIIGLGSKIGGSILSHLTGLDTKTLQNVITDPNSFSKIQREATNRPSVAQEFGDSLDELVNKKSDTGEEYNSIKDSNSSISVSADLIPGVLGKYGLKLKGGKVVADADSITRNPSDILAIQRFVDNWANKENLTPKQFLNMRSDAKTELARFDSDKSTAPKTIGKELYAKLNEQIRPRITGLQELDARMSPVIEQFKRAKKDFLTPDGEFKDGAINKIVNATGAGKDQLLSRMEEISPGITKSIQVLKAIEDIERANNLKVGAYTRGIIEGGGLISGNIPLLIAAILTSPESAVAILRKAGVVGKAVLPILNILKKISGKSSKGLMVSALNQKNNSVEK